MFVNGGPDALRFHFPPGEVLWHLLVDSADGETGARSIPADSIEVQGRSVMLFANRAPKALR